MIISLLQRAVFVTEWVSVDDVSDYLARYDFFLCDLSVKLGVVATLIIPSFVTAMYGIVFLEQCQVNAQ